MSRTLAIAVILGMTAVTGRAAAQNAPAAPRPVVVQVRLDNQAINPVAARFIERAIEQAEQ